MSNNYPLPLPNLDHEYTDAQVMELERAGMFEELYLCFRKRAAKAEARIGKIKDTHTEDTLPLSP